VCVCVCSCALGNEKGSGGLVISLGQCYLRLLVMYRVNTL
jgi:hypothetical protein